MIELELPWPPSVNHYYRRVGPRTLISREGRAYRDEVGSLLASLGLSAITGRLALVVEAHPPDLRRRDLDNLGKALADSLEHGGAYRDDSQIDILIIARREPTSGGVVVVRLTPFPLVRCPVCGAAWKSRTSV